MQDTLDIIGPGYEYDFTGCSILAQGKDTAQVCNIIFLNTFLLDYTASYCWKRKRWKRKR